MTCTPANRGYRELKNRVIAFTGLAFYADQDHLMAEVIGQRVSELDLRTCAAYSALLSSGQPGDAEMEILTARLTIGETSFFRGEEQYAAIRDIIIPDILERKQSSKEIKIWSAGCATGAEPYSVAILLENALAPRSPGWRINIQATDINREYLAQALEGKFRERALRSTPGEVRSRCFSKDGRLWAIDPRYKEWISFHYMNLIGDEFPNATDFDLILCRNVMIYFSVDVRRRLIGQFHRALNPCGWLVVGETEHTLTDYHAFRPVSANGTKFYQTIGMPTEEPWSPPVPDPEPVASQRATAETAAPETAADPVPSLDGLRQLIHRGEWSIAADYGERALALDRLNPAIHLYQALVFQNMGSAYESEKLLRQAIYLDRKFALAHYHLGLALKRTLRKQAADRCFVNVLKVLEDSPDKAPVMAGSGVTAAGLRDMAKIHLAKASVE